MPTAKEKVFNPEKLQDYILATVVRGEPKEASYKTYVDPEIYDANQAVKVIERNSQFTKILEQVVLEHDVETKRALAAARRKHYERYADLLDQGHETITIAESVKEKAEAMGEQRKNLAIPMISQVIVGNQLQQNSNKFDNSGLIE